MKTSEPRLAYAAILRFWLPLAATWLMMAVEGPFLAAVIARLAAEKLNLAAYGVAFAFALVAEAPIIMLMSASTALCRNADSYRRLRNFSLTLSAAVTLLLALFLLPPVYDLIALRLIGLPPAVAGLTHGALACLLPWPGAIGLRRFYQGVLIAGHQTRRVAGATLLRLCGMAGTALYGYFFTSLSGAMIGAIALSAGVSLESLMTRFLARQNIARLLATPAGQDAEILSYPGIGRYYLPLALTPLIGLAIHPVVTFFLGKSPAPVESLAVMPVIFGLTFIFRALGLSYQEVAIALIGENRENYRRVRNFAALLGLATSGCLSLIAWTPLNRIWFEDLSGLSQQLSGFAQLPLQIMAIFPALTVLICFQRSLLIVARTTRPVSLATALEALCIFALLTLSILYLPLPGAVAATTAYVVGRLFGIGMLQRPARRASGLFAAAEDS